MDLRPDINVSDLSAGGLAFPAFGSGVDIDFVNRRYWWNGAAKTEANFTTFNLNGSTFGPNGLLPTDTIDVTLALAGLGSLIPGAMAVGFRLNSVPGTARTIVTLDDGTTAERIAFTVSTGGTTAFVVSDNNVTQASMSTAALTLQRHGLAGSFDVNNFLGGADGVALTSDNVGTLPTVTTLRVGRAPAAAAFTGSISRIVLFTATKPQGQCNYLSSVLRAY